MKRQRLAVVGLFTIGAALVVAPPEPTTAAWTLPQQMKGTFEAGTVMPPTSLTCTAGGLQDVRFSWALPAAGLPITGYKWTLTPTSLAGPSDAGIINNPGQTSVPVSFDILAIGSAEFSIVAKGPGNWESAPVKGRVSVLGLLIPVSTSCTV